MIRTATPDDTDAIASLHADSWRRNYRGAYSDSFLDGEVLEDRRAVWSGRLRDQAGEPPPGTTATFVAECEGTFAGFAHVDFAAHEQWGALLDNLHVTHGLKRSGIGTLLMAAVGGAVTSRSSGGKLHLYVLEQNTAAQAFYDARGGRCVEASFVSAPGGVTSRLRGTPRRLLYVWDDPSILVAVSDPPSTTLPPSSGSGEEQPDLRR